MAVKEGSSCRANAFLYELLVGVVITVTITNGVMGKKRYRDDRLGLFQLRDSSR